MNRLTSSISSGDVGWRWLPAALTFVLAFALLTPSVLALPQDGDESQYAWSAAYFAGKIARLDFTRDGSDWLTDPGWSATSVWALTQPMGARFTYMLAMGLTGDPPPAASYDYGRIDEPQPDAVIPATTLLALRLTSAFCAALGLALLALRLGWRGLLASVLFLAMPSVRDSLALARAEGQLLLGFGLCAVTIGSRWFPAASATAAAFKLTALGLWPLLLWPAATGKWRRLPVLGPVVLASALWGVLNPTTWYGFGPASLVNMLGYRIFAFNYQSSHPFHREVTLGVYTPARYFWPVELAVVLLAVITICRLWPRVGRWRRSGPPIG